MSEIDYNQAVQAVKNAVERAGRQKVEALLGRYDANNVRELRYCHAAEFIREARELQPDPPPPVAPPARNGTVLVPVKFIVGDRVSNSDDTTQPVAGLVVGYEVRYIVKQDHLPMPTFARRGEKLKHAPAAPPAPPAAVGNGRAWTIGSAIDDMKRATLGQSFTTDGTELIASLRTYGLYIVEGPL